MPIEYDTNLSDAINPQPASSKWPRDCKVKFRVSDAEVYIGQFVRLVDSRFGRRLLLRFEDGTAITQFENSCEKAGDSTMLSPSAPTR
ncbi:hypothetical protein Hypma_009506 [Hypsizygus marmoreus]|uniref:Uncharacterized protein n=1 Tax=Hypsizygus marmoreus TaxID=39966 RepID=A0A369JQX7_HYPMA|nr:hypothetical protein Hypma_009506 [Hypsizygus marmoreus]